LCESTPTTTSILASFFWQGLRLEDRREDIHGSSGNLLSSHFRRSGADRGDRHSKVRGLVVSTLNRRVILGRFPDNLPEQSPQPRYFTSVRIQKRRGSPLGGLYRLPSMTP
jgi:hypothetical protein